MSAILALRVLLWLLCAYVLSKSVEIWFGWVRAWVAQRKGEPEILPVEKLKRS